MNEKGLIAPIHKIVDMLHYLRPEVKHIAIVINRIRNNDKIKDEARFVLSIFVII